MKYALLEKDTNKLLGWYLEKEKNRIEVTNEDWQEALTINANCYENGKFVVKDFRTDEEIEQQKIQTKINEAKTYLALTDYKMTVDYFATLSKEIQDELILKRAEAREFIRANN